VAILIKNPGTERKARELATLKGETITGVIDAALDHALADARPKRRKPTIEEMNAATERLWDRAGVRPPFPPVTKEEWDEINEIPGLAEDWE
jgi:antitoxin VapB